MNNLENAAVHTDFLLFAREAFKSLNDGEKLTRDPYIKLIASELMDVADGKTKRLLINLPPRHGKTFLASIALSAWVLAHYPSQKIMVLTHAEHLAEEIAYLVREIMDSRWFKLAFTTRLAANRKKVLDFKTTAGGGLYAASLGGSITGRGADLIIVDDPVDIDDADDTDEHDRVKELLDTKVDSRLNNQKKGRRVIIAHRLNKNDLSGHVLDRGGWKHLCLPLIALSPETYQTEYGPWHRKEGELLRPDAYTPEIIRELEQRALFHSIYQQDPDAGNLFRINEQHFPLFTLEPDGKQPLVLSIDPGQANGPDSSYSVIQVWCPQSRDHWLIDQWRNRASYDGVKAALKHFVRAYRPAVALIEQTALGTALLSDCRPRKSFQVIPVIPGRRSKATRLRPHLDLIRGGRVWLPERARWRHEYVEEFAKFPGAFTDQVDATTQYLDKIDDLLPLAVTEPGGLCAGRGRSGMFANRTPFNDPRIKSVIGMSVGRHSFRR
jgi:predicted phage terminase large subunit-like protein